MKSPKELFEDELRFQWEHWRTRILTVLIAILRLSFGSPLNFTIACRSTVVRYISPRRVKDRWRFQCFHYSQQ